MKVSEFEGKLDPDEFLKWLHTMEKVFNYKEIPKDRKVNLIALRLKKYALFGELTFMLKELEKERARFLLGRK